MREDVQAAAPMTGMARKPAESGRGGHRGLALGLVLLAQLLVVIDVSIVTLALPAIQRAFHFSPVGLQWVLSGYALAFGGFLLLGGRLADLLGRRRILVIGAAVFTAASLACALAGSAGMLVAARVVEGLGAAMMAPAALSLILAMFPEGPARNKALGAFGAVSGAGGAIGVLVGSHRPVPDETRAGGTLTRAAQEQSDGDFGEGQALPQRVRGRAPASRMSRDPPRAVRRGDRYRGHIQQPGKGDRSLAWRPLRQGLASGWAGCLHTVFLPAGALLRSQIADR